MDIKHAKNFVKTEDGHWYKVDDARFGDLIDHLLFKDGDYRLPAECLMKRDPIQLIIRDDVLACPNNTNRIIEIGITTQQQLETYYASIYQGKVNPNKQHTLSSYIITNRQRQVLKMISKGHNLSSEMCASVPFLIERGFVIMKDGQPFLSQKAAIWTKYA